MLDILAVDPKWQGRGAGSGLVKWGLDFADKMDFRQVHSPIHGDFTIADWPLSRSLSSLLSVEEQCMRKMDLK